MTYFTECATCQHWYAIIPSWAILAAIIKLKGKACYILEGHIPHVVHQVGIGSLSKPWREATAGAGVGSRTGAGAGEVVEAGT